MQFTVAQDNVNKKEMVGFACYFGGQPTETVVKVTKLLKAKKYKKISSMLSSKNIGEKYLAIISLQRLDDMKEYQLSDLEKDLISKAKLSNDSISVCSGCTYFDKVPLKKILSEKSFMGASNWLDRTLRQD